MEESEMDEFSEMGIKTEKVLEISSRGIQYAYDRLFDDKKEPSLADITKLIDLASKSFELAINAFEFDLASSGFSDDFEDSSEFDDSDDDFDDED